MENKNKVKVNYSADQLLRLNSIENRIRDKLHSIKADYKEIGKLLYEAKKFLPHKQFQPWIEKTFGNDLSYQSAYTYKKAYEELRDKDPSISKSLPISFLVHMYQKEFPDEVKEIIYSDWKHVLKYGDLNKIVDAYKAYKEKEITLDEFKAQTEAQVEKGKAVRDGTWEAREAEKNMIRYHKLIRMFGRIDKNVRQFDKHFNIIQSVNPLHNDQIRDMHGKVEEMIKSFRGLNDLFEGELTENSNN